MQCINDIPTWNVKKLQSVLPSLSAWLFASLSACMAVSVSVVWPFLTACLEVCIRPSVDLSVVWNEEMVITLTGHSSIVCVVFARSYRCSDYQVRTRRHRYLGIGIDFKLPFLDWIILYSYWNHSNLSRYIILLMQQLKGLMHRNSLQHNYSLANFAGIRSSYITMSEKLSWPGNVLQTPSPMPDKTALAEDLMEAVK